MKTYAIGIVRPKERTFLDRFLRRETDIYMDWCPCPICGSAIVDFEPVIVDHYWGNTNINMQWSEIDGINLAPCGCRVNHLIYVKQGYEHMIPPEVGREEGLNKETSTC